MYYCNRVVVEAPCKVNLSLDITGTMENGYHTVETVMQSVGLCDVLVIGKRGDNELRVTCSNPLAPENDMNIAYLAAKEFFLATGVAEQGLSIHIDKSIPVEAGLAGGSADAAAVLIGLNRLLEAGLSPEQLAEIGLKIGMDVPFCLKGGCALGKERGEALTALTPLPDCFFAVAKPPRGMNTRCAFELYDSHEGDVARPNTQRMLESISNGDLTGIGENMHSVFGAIGKAEETELLSGIMLCAGALGSVLSGSGSAVVGLIDNEKTAKICLHLLREQVRECWIAKPTEAGARLLHLS